MQVINNNNNNNNNNAAQQFVAPVSTLVSNPITTPAPGTPVNQFGPAAPPASPSSNPGCPLPQSTLNVSCPPDPYS